MENNHRSYKKTKAQSTFLKNIIKIIIVFIVLYFVYRQLATNWTEVVNYSWNVNLYLLVLSVVMHLFTFILFSRVWCFLIAALGYKVKLTHAFKISYIANLGRYIPGKIWPVFGMAYLAKQLGIREEKSVTSWVVAMIFALPSAFMAGFICILISPEILSEELSKYLGPGVYLTAAVIFMISLSLIFIPGKSLSILNVLLKLIKKPKIDFNLKISTALIIYGGYLICWIVYGLSFWVFINSVTSGSNLPVLPAVAAFVIAYQIGYLAIFAPGGMGIRELVLAIILTPYLGPAAFGIAVVARVWNLITEIISALIAWSIKFPDKSDL